MSENYQRPVLSNEEVNQAYRFARELSTLYPARRIVVIGSLLVENARLLREVNQLREKLGIDPLAEHKLAG